MDSFEKIYFAGSANMNINSIMKNKNKNPGSPKSKLSSNESVNSFGEDVNECKYCFTEDSEKNLIQPCNCQGSLRNVHEECLCEWIQKSKKNLELTYENGLAYYCSKCELCNFQMKFQINYKNNFFFTLFITLKNLLMSFEKLSYFIFHTIIIFYFFNRLDFIVTNGLDVLYKNLNTISIVRFLNEMCYFVTILWYSKDIIKYYLNTFSEERRIIMKFVTIIVKESKEKKCMLHDLINDLTDKKNKHKNYEDFNNSEKEKVK